MVKTRFCLHFTQSKSKLLKMLKKLVKPKIENRKTHENASCQERITIYTHKLNDISFTR